MYNKFLVLVVGFGCLTLSANGQKYSTEQTFVSFFSDAAIEDITAENKKTAGAFNSPRAISHFLYPSKIMSLQNLS